MRKILLGTTAVAGAAMMTMGIAQAQTAPTVRVGGYFDFTVGYIDDSADRNRVSGTTGIAARDRFDFRSDAEIVVNVTGKAANGLQYGAVIELQVDGFGAGAGTAIDTDEMYMFIASPTLGRLILGDEDSATSLMQVRAPTVAQAGAGSGWANFVQHQSGARYLMGGINDGSDATKIVYMTPQFFGFDFGVSFAANSHEGERELVAGSAGALAVGPGSVAMQRDGAGLRNELSAALRYRGSFGNVGVAANIGGQTAEAAVTAAAGTPNVTAYNAGLTVTAFGLTVGGEYVFGKYSGGSPGRTAAAPGRSNSSHFVLGATYTTGAISVGAFYGSATQDSGAGAADLRQNVWGLGANYSIAPGLIGFANYTSVEDKNRAAIGNPGLATRSVDAFLVGMALAF